MSTISGSVQLIIYLKTTTNKQTDNLAWRHTVRSQFERGSIKSFTKEDAHPWSRNCSRPTTDKAGDSGLGGISRCKTGHGTLKNVKNRAKIKTHSGKEQSAKLMNAWLNWCVQVWKFDYSAKWIVYWNRFFVRYTVVLLLQNEDFMEIRYFCFSREYHGQWFLQMLVCTHLHS